MNSLSHFNKLGDKLPDPFDWTTKFLLHLFIQKHLLYSYYVLGTISDTCTNEINQQIPALRNRVYYPNLLSVSIIHIYLTTALGFQFKIGILPLLTSFFHHCPHHLYLYFTENRMIILYLGLEIWQKTIMLNWPKSLFRFGQLNLSVMCWQKEGKLYVTLKLNRTTCEILSTLLTAVEIKLSIWVWSSLICWKKLGHPTCEFCNLGVHFIFIPVIVPVTWAT